MDQQDAASSWVDDVVDVARGMVADGRAHDAVETLWALLANEPDHPAALHALAEALQADGDPAEALVVARRAVTVDPERYRSFHLLGLAAYACGAWDEVRPAFAAAAELAPEDLAVASDALAVELAMGRSDAQTYVIARRASEQHPADPVIAALVGMLFHREGHRGTAETVWRAGLVATPTDPVLRWRMLTSSAERGADAAVVEHGLALRMEHPSQQTDRLLRLAVTSLLQHVHAVFFVGALVGVLLAVLASSVVPGRWQRLADGGVLLVVLGMVGVAVNLVVRVATRRLRTGTAPLLRFVRRRARGLVGAAVLVAATGVGALAAVVGLIAGAPLPVVGWCGAVTGAVWLATMADLTWLDRWYR